MKAAAIKIKRYAGSVNIVDNNNLRHRLGIMMLSALGALALLYLIILTSMVFNIVGRRSLEAEARTLSNQVSDLELQYLSMTDKIDLNLSHSLGFKEAPTQFATRKSLGSIKVVNNEL
ncbi:MAG TPA: hypothetical protein VG694_03055 [Candidatus Paceibacterota bacterium]|jgi:hypothetical protein|nr:hypothetical protein [Candidatus Paceibacterota bacterium]